MSSLGLATKPKVKPDPVPQLLRPHQVEERLEERKEVESILRAPDYVRSQIGDMAALRRRLQAIDQSLDEGLPRAYQDDAEKQRAIDEELRMRQLLVDHMPSRDTMMRNPPGAVDRHRRFEREHKNSILAWRNLRLRLHASGVDFGFDRDIANLEVYRPLNHGGGELDASTAQIQRKAMFHFGADPANAVIFTDDEIGRIREVAPEICDRLAFASNFERQQIRDALDGVGEPEASERKPSKAAVAASDKPGKG